MPFHECKSNNNIHETHEKYVETISLHLSDTHTCMFTYTCLYICTNDNAPAAEKDAINTATQNYILPYSIIPFYYEAEHFRNKVKIQKVICVEWELFLKLISFLTRHNDKSGEYF